MDWPRGRPVKKAKKTVLSDFEQRRATKRISDLRCSLEKGKPGTLVSGLFILRCESAKAARGKAGAKDGLFNEWNCNRVKSTARSKGFRRDDSALSGMQNQSRSRKVQRSTFVRVLKLKSLFSKIGNSTPVNVLFPVSLLFPPIFTTIALLTSSNCG